MSASLLGTPNFINKLFIDNFLLPSTASHSPSLQVESIPTLSTGVANSSYYYFYLKFSFLIRPHIFLITCSVRALSQGRSQGTPWAVYHRVIIIRDAVIAIFLSSSFGLSIKSVCQFRVSFLKRCNLQHIQRKINTNYSFHNERNS